MENNIKKESKVAIVGLGYVGLPLACLCASKGYETYAIDINEEKINIINSGKVPFNDDDLQKELDEVKLIATTDLSNLENADIIIVCVPTPIDELHNPNLIPIKSASESIAKYLKKGQLIIIESTVNPGVCEDVVQPILEKTGLKSGSDFDIAHCPERINPGDKKWNTKNIPRVVGASSTNGLDKALSFYRSIVDANIRPMKSIKEAEATKIIENTFRDVNIAFVNELAKSFDKMDIDLIEVIKGAATKPFAFLAHFPGCGIGGHCIPVDPYYLIEEAKQKGFNHKFLKMAREINTSMPEHTVNLLITELNKLGKSLKGTKVGLLGVSYKENVDDIRESPALEIVKILNKLEADLQVYDPYVLGKSSVKDIKEILDKSEVLIIATAHQQFKDIDINDFKANNIKVIVDGRNCLDKDGIKALGILYKGIGR